MPATVVIGAQWGDEGKGKVVHQLARDAQIVCRFGGSDNAGHTIIVDNKKEVLHLLPCGITYPNKLNLVGPGVLCNLETLAQELSMARHRFGSSIMLDPGAHVVLKIHMLLDGAAEDAATTGEKIGTTRRGIGPAASTRAARSGVRLGDLMSLKTIRAALEARNFYEELCATARYRGIKVTLIPSLDDTAQKLATYSAIICPLLRDTRAILAEALDRGESVLIEGAQGVGLDRNLGTYPFVTSTECTVGGMMASLGVRTQDIEEVLGVTKAYVTRVGAGPFPTKMDDLVQAEILRTKGNEVGATTGRPRDCGWLDLMQLRYTSRVGGIKSLAMTKADVLDGEDFPEIKVCTDYYDTSTGTYVGKFRTLTTEIMQRAVPTYTTLPGWSVKNCAAWTSFKSLPKELQNYMQFVANFTETPVIYMSVGPKPEHYFDCNVKPNRIIS